MHAKKGNGNSQDTKKVIVQKMDASGNVRVVKFNMPFSFDLSELYDSFHGEPEILD